MLLIKNITNVPLTINGNTIYPKTSKVLNIEYNMSLKSLERLGLASIIYTKEEQVDEEIPIIARRRKRKSSEAIEENKQDNLESE